MVFVTNGNVAKANVAKVLWIDRTKTEPFEIHRKWQIYQMYLFILIIFLCFKPQTWGFKIPETGAEAPCSGKATWNSHNNDGAGSRQIALQWCTWSKYDLDFAARHVYRCFPLSLTELRNFAKKI